MLKVRFVSDLQQEQQEFLQQLESNNEETLILFYSCLQTLIENQPINLYVYNDLEEVYRDFAVAYPIDFHLSQWKKVEMNLFLENIEKEFFLCLKLFRKLSSEWNRLTIVLTISKDKKQQYEKYFTYYFPDGST